MKTSTLPNVNAVQTDRPASVVARIRRRVASLFIALAFGLVGTVGIAGVASAQTPSDAAGVMASAGTGLSTQLLLVAAAIVVPAVTILAVKKGWPLLKRFF